MTDYGVGAYGEDSYGGTTTSGSTDSTVQPDTQQQSVFMYSDGLYPRLGAFRLGEMRLGADPPPELRFDSSPPVLDGHIDGPATRQHIETVAHDQLVRRIDVTDDGERANLSGATVEWRAATVRGAESVLSDESPGVTATVTDATAGEITLTIASDVTGDLDGRYHHECDVIGANDIRRTVTVGTFRVKRATTPSPTPAP